MTWWNPRLAGAYRGRVLVTVLAFAGILAALMQTIVIPLAAQLPDMLGVGADSASWVITATLLTAAVVTPISGRLGDMYGKRRVLLVCLAILTLGCAICALSSTLWVVLLGRVLQGTATSAIPLGMSILRDELRPVRVPTAIALISATLGAGASVGLPVSAFVAQHFDWHLMFWSAAAIGVIAMVVVRIFVPESPVRTPGRFDYVGALGLATALLCLLVPITKGAAWGWSSAAVIVPLMLCPVLATWWVWYETRAANPVVDIAISMSRPVLLTNIAAVLAGFAMFTQQVLTPQLLQADPSTGYGPGRSIIVAALALAPSGFAMMLVSPIAGRLSNRFSAKTTLIAGLLISCLGYACATVVPFGVWQLTIVSAINGAGVGLAYGTMPALVISAVPESETAAATGLNTLMRMIGSSSASAVLAMLLTMITMQTADATAPAEMSFRLGFGLGGMAALAAVVVAAYLRAGGHGRRTVDVVEAAVPGSMPSEYRPVRA
ncbi:MFS transporter [Nocardia cyriacigeorgica]|uniref:MFS transporter n=1 Tax=Nocardia cyriacigeorgica TaxID=135487 RepID=UPI0013BA62DD|nr:MFS transporter [Nocardia cyriacigeorgica]NEW37544.1 MFS transporter [Nocardia cyriacigeorgica]NEW49068.1 MFS transporter [Nocardia cyriacigeorgica]